LTAYIVAAVVHTIDVIHSKSKNATITRIYFILFVTHIYYREEKYYWPIIKCHASITDRNHVKDHRASTTDLNHVKDHRASTTDPNHVKKHLSNVIDLKNRGKKIKNGSYVRALKVKRKLSTLVLQATVTITVLKPVKVLGPDIVVIPQKIN
jgi:hypothetical protein